MRVAVYCRVSTDHEDQANSLTSQKRYFREYIDRQPLWTLVEIYVDEGISGTSTKGRAAFNRMIADAQQDRFDLILTKEISRFARNTLDSIFYTRKLKELGIGVYFMNDNIYTLESDAELRLAIMSSIAQEESRKTSERVKWGQKRRMEQGVVFGRSLLGYTVKGGNISVNEEGAKTVRLIFYKFVNEGKGTHIIARELQEAGIPTYSHISCWSNTVILRILQNEKYVGDLIQKKTYTPSYLTHQKKYNQGEEPQVALSNHHEPIIDRELFDSAQQELNRRRCAKKQRARHSGRYCFSGKIKCGLCGCIFVSRIKLRKDGSTYHTWRCFQGTKYGLSNKGSEDNPKGCSNRQINNEDLLFIMSQVVKSLPLDKESLLLTLTQAICTALQSDRETENLKKLQYKTDHLAQKKQGLIDLYLSREITKLDFEKVNQKYENEINTLKQEQTDCIQNQKLTQNRGQNPDNDAANILWKILNGEIQDEPFYRGILDSITIYDRNYMDISFSFLPTPFSFLIVQNGSSSPS